MTVISTNLADCHNLHCSSHITYLSTECMLYARVCSHSNFLCFSEAQYVWRARWNLIFWCTDCGQATLTSSPISEPFFLSRKFRRIRFWIDVDVRRFQSSSCMRSRPTGDVDFFSLSCHISCIDYCWAEEIFLSRACVKDVGRVLWDSVVGLWELYLLRELFIA